MLGVRRLNMLSVLMFYVISLYKSVFYLLSASVASRTALYKFDYYLLLLLLLLLNHSLS